MEMVKCWYKCDELYPYYELEQEWIGHEDEFNPEIPLELFNIIDRVMYRFFIVQNMIKELTCTRDFPHQRPTVERMQQMIIEYKEKTSFKTKGENDD